MLIRTKKVKLICIIILIIFTNKLIHAESVNINSASTYIENNIFYLDSSSELYLSKEAYKALQQGISFEIHTDFQVLIKRKWFWNKIIFEKKIIHKLEHKLYPKVVRWFSEGLLRLEDGKVYFENKELKIGDINEK